MPDLVHCNLGFSKEDNIIVQASQFRCTQITPLFLLSVLYIDRLNDYNRQDGQKQWAYEAVHWLQVHL